MQYIPVTVISSISIASVVLEIYFDCDLVAKEDFWISTASPFQGWYGLGRSYVSSIVVIL